MHRNKNRNYKTSLPLQSRLPRFPAKSLLRIFLLLVLGFPATITGQSLEDELTRLENGSLSDLRLFLSRYPATVVDAQGRTALMSVLRWKIGGLEAARLLLDAGVQINTQTAHRKTALEIAASIGNPDLVRLFLQRGASVEVEAGTPLHSAFFAWGSPDRGDPKAVIAALLEARAPVEVCDKDGRRPLHFAAMQGKADAVRMLLAAGADPQAPDLNSGNSPLHWAAAAGSLDAVQQLLAAGAPADARNSFDCTTALHRAAARGHGPVVAVLLAARAAINPTDRNAATPLALAEEQGHNETAAILRRAGGLVATLPTVRCEAQAPKERRPCQRRTPPKKEEWHVDGNFQAALAHLEQAVLKWENDNRIFLSQEIVQEMKASLSYAAGMLCVTSGEISSDSGPISCQTLLAGGEALRDPLAAFLEDAILVGRPQVISLFSRFADTLVVDATAGMGYPAAQPNRYACATLPTPMRVRLPTLGGTRLSTDPVTKYCLLPGDYEVEISDPKSTLTYQISAAIRHVSVGKGILKRAQPAVVLPNLEFYCPDPEGGVVHPMARWGGRDAPQPRPGEAGPFAIAPVGRVEILDPLGLCPAACRQALGLTLVQAIQLWKGACDSCSPSSLTALGVGDRVFVDRILLDRLLLAKNLGEALESTTPIPEEGSLFLNRFSVAGPRPRKPFPPYVEISKGSSLANALCDRVAAAPGVPVPLRVLLCWSGSEALAKGDAALRLELTHQADCVPDAIACATVQRGVLLSAGTYAFRAPPELSSEQGVTLRVGQGEQEVDLLTVLAHEVGHWFGLPHLDDERATSGGRINAMYPTLSPNGHCLTAANLQMLANAGRGDWYYKQTDCAGLRPADRGDR